MTDDPSAARELLRHTVATLAYRAEKTLRDVPPDFGGFRLAEGSRSAVEIVAHMGDLMAWGERMAQGEYVWDPRPSSEWSAACDRFFRALASFDRALAASTFDKYAPGVIFQGPIADALTHVGQIAIMRGVAGAAVRPESYARAEIAVGRVGRDQSAARKEFDGDASRRRPSPPAPPTRPDPVNEASEASFPASDPPADTPLDGAQISPKKS
jgi:hypothetical protein